MADVVSLPLRYAEGCGPQTCRGPATELLFDDQRFGMTDPQP